jgi:hypothetical protein
MFPMAGALGFVAMSGCLTRHETRAKARVQAACEPVAADTASLSFAPSGLVGTHTLTLVARSGQRSGSRAVGAVHLLKSDSADRGRRADGTAIAPEPFGSQVHPLYGWADITLADVGAIGERSTRVRDPIYPGVLVIVFPANFVSDRRTHVMLELGSGSRDATVTLDAPSTFLDADHIDSGGVWGRWTSGGLSRVADGYFCLVRTKP